MADSIRENWWLAYDRLINCLCFVRRRGLELQFLRVQAELIIMPLEDDVIGKQNTVVDPHTDAAAQAEERRSSSAGRQKPTMDALNLGGMESSQREAGDKQSRSDLNLESPRALEACMRQVRAGSCAYLSHPMDDSCAPGGSISEVALCARTAGRRGK